MKVDMSPQAISARLRQVSELRDLCVYLGRVGKEHRRKVAAAGEGAPSNQATSPELPNTTSAN